MPLESSSFYCFVLAFTSILCLGTKQAYSADAPSADTIKKGFYRNPVIPGDFADPSIIKVGNTYYAAGTSSEWGPHFPLFTSTDLVNWKQAGYIFNTPPSWTSSSFWAPELFYYKNTFYVYYVAKRKKDNVSFIGVATAKDPLKGFTDQGPIVEHGTEAIDPFVINEKGTLYMTFKAYGLDKRPIELLGCKLSADGLKVEGEYFSLLKDEERKGMEGQVLIKKNDYYYLFYSAGNCCGIKCSYNVRVTRSKTLEGPYEVYSGNPILTENETWKCPGHGTLVQAYGDRYFYLYHAYSVKDNVFTGRQGMLDELVWNTTTGWPAFKQGASPSVSNASPGKTTQVANHNWEDKFDGGILNQSWQWDFRHSKPEVRLAKGELYLTGDTLAGNKNTGVAITIRPVTGDYEIITELLGANNSLDGLVLYGDAGQAVGIGVDDAKKVVVWEIKNGKHLVLAEAGTYNTIRLRMDVKDGYLVRFYRANGEGPWQELKLEGGAAYDGKFLAPWDRSPRPGLIHRGSRQERGDFGYFRIRYK
jgi:beta-xylosidase